MNAPGNITLPIPSVTPGTNAAKRGEQNKNTPTMDPSHIRCCEVPKESELRNYLYTSVAPAQGSDDGILTLSNTVA